jgi:DNA-binding response OmpR family regulator
VLHALAVEDNDRLAADLAAALRGLAYVNRVSTADEALAVLGMCVPDVVLLDLCGTSDEAPLLVAASVRMALDRAGNRVGTRVPLVLHSGLDPHVLRGIAGSLDRTHALPRPASRNELRALITSLTA